MFLGTRSTSPHTQPWCDSKRATIYTHPYLTPARAPLENADIKHRIAPTRPTPRRRRLPFAERARFGVGGGVVQRRLRGVDGNFWDLGLEIDRRRRRNGPRRRPWHGEREPETPEPRGCLAASHPATPPTARLSERAHHPGSTEGARTLALETVRFGAFSATGRGRATERIFEIGGAGASPNPPGRCTR